MDEPKACPFCGKPLIYREHRAISIRGNPILRYYQHEKTGCLLDLYEVYEDDIPSWNRRAGERAAEGVGPYGETVADAVSAAEEVERAAEGGG